MNKPNKQITRGALTKVAIDRMRLYAALLTTFMVGHEYLINHGTKWWYILLVPVVIYAMYLDVKHMIRGEQMAMWQLHPFAQDQYDMIKQIRNKVHENSKEKS